ncbi:MAG: flagellar motor switch protein FliG [Spirochaetales bacterium]|nr:flagellar motor switch protein FliG [Spirochaetales bacterium]
MAVDSGKKRYPEKDAFLKTRKRDKGYKKAAMLLIILGKEHSSEVLKHLTEEEALGIAKEIASIKKIDNREAEKVLEEFGYLLKVKNLVAKGGLEKAKEMLFTAFGEEKGEVFYNKIIERTVPHPFSFLNDLPIEQVLTLIKNESAPVVAVILSHIDPTLSAKLLTALPPDTRRDTVARIARMDKITPEILRKTEEVLREKVRAQGDMITQEVDGKLALTEILKHMDVQKEKEILSDLSICNPELAEDIETRLFNLDVVYRISNKDLQKVLREYDDKDIAFLLKGKDGDFSQRIIRNVSNRRAEIIRLEHQSIGRVLKSDVEKSDTDFLLKIRNMAENEEITIFDKNEEYID